MFHWRNCRANSGLICKTRAGFFSWRRILRLLLMRKTITAAFLLVFAAKFFITGYKSRGGTSTPGEQSFKSSDRDFRTPFQNESQFIVETIVSDLAEQIY